MLLHEAAMVCAVVKMVRPLYVRPGHQRCARVFQEEAVEQSCSISFYVRGSRRRRKQNYKTVF